MVSVALRGRTRIHWSLRAQAARQNEPNRSDDHNRKCQRHAEPVTNRCTPSDPIAQKNALHDTHNPQEDEDQLRQFFASSKTEPSHTDMIPQEGRLA